MMASVFLGLLVGVIGTFTGLGGGIIMVPLLPVLLGATQKEAIATSLCVVFLNGMQLTYLAFRKKNLDLRFVLPIALIGIMTAYFSSLLVYRFSNYSLRLFLVCIMALVIYVLLRPPKFDFHKGKNLFRYSVGAFSGLVSGLTGLGGGIVLGPLLLAGRAIHHQQLTSTTSFVSMCFAGIATITHMALNPPSMLSWGPILWQSALFIFVPALLITKILYPMQAKLTEVQRRKLLLLFSLVLFLKSVVSLISNP
jgi:uncharacterized membrane protein YfcA